jgi:hypothetical protein
MESLQRVKLAGFDVVIAELEVELDYQRRPPPVGVSGRFAATTRPHHHHHQDAGPVPTSAPPSSTSAKRSANPARRLTG